MLFGAVQTCAVVFGLAFGVAQLRDLGRQRGQASLEVMLEEWRRSYEERDLVLDKMPCHSGTVPGRTAEFARVVCSMDHDDLGMQRILVAARRVVHEINDLGGFLERGLVSERDVFGHLHVRIIELVYLLEPYFLAATVCRGTRWGIRLRRMRTGAERYHQRNPVHRHRTITVRGVVLLEASGEPGLLERLRRVRQKRLIPSKDAALEDDDAAIVAVRRAFADAEIDVEELARRLAWSS